MTKNYTFFALALLAATSLSPSAFAQNSSTTSNRNGVRITGQGTLKSDLDNGYYDGVSKSDTAKAAGKTGAVINNGQPLSNTAQTGARIHTSTDGQLSPRALQPLPSPTTPGTVSNMNGVRTTTQNPTLVPSTTSNAAGQRSVDAGSLATTPNVGANTSGSLNTDLNTGGSASTGIGASVSGSASGSAGASGGAK